MIKWYKDKECEIYFSEKPNVKVRYISPFTNEEEKKQIIKKPFINLFEFFVELKDIKKSKDYKFKIEKNYSWDGASIPRIFWRILGSNTDNKYLIPSLIHDVMCENHSFIDNDRCFSSRVFEKLLKVSNVSSAKRLIMYHSVDNFQKFKGW